MHRASGVPHIPSAGNKLIFHTWPGACFKIGPQQHGMNANGAAPRYNNAVMNAGTDVDGIHIILGGKK